MHASLIRFAHTALAPLALLTLVGSGFSQTAFTVGTPDSDFWFVQDAVNQAPDGSVLIVERVVGGRIVIDGKSLSIFIHPEQEPVGIRTNSWLTGWSIQNLRAGQRVVIRGFFVGALDLLLKDNEGTVWFESCRLLPGSYGHAAGFWPIRCINSKDVVFRNLEAPDFTFAFPHHQGVRIQAQSSALRLFDSHIEGALRVPDPSIVLEGSSLTLSDCTITGGSSRDCSAEGAPAIRADGTSVIYAENTTLEGGFAGGVDDLFADCGRGDQAEALEIDTGGTFVERQKAPIRWTLEPVVEAGETRSAFLWGEPGSIVFLVYSTDASMGFSSTLGASLLRAFGSPTSFITTKLNANGRALVQETPTVPPGFPLQARVLFAQPLAVTPHSGIVLGPPTAFTAVSSL